MQPYDLKEGPQHWDNIKHQVADANLNWLRKFSPNLTDDKILARVVESPLDLERRFGISGGNIFHGEMSLDQMFFLRPVAGWARYRTPVRGLYLCGSGAHPGGGVTGAPGHNAAQAVIADHLQK